MGFLVERRIDSTFGQIVKEEREKKKLRRIRPLITYYLSDNCPSHSSFLSLPSTSCFVPPTVRTRLIRFPATTLHTPHTQLYHYSLPPRPLLLQLECVSRARLYVTLYFYLSLPYNIYTVKSLFFGFFRDLSWETYK